MTRSVHVSACSILGLLAGCSCADRGLSAGAGGASSAGDTSSTTGAEATTSGLSAGESTYGGDEPADASTGPTPSGRARILAYGAHGGVPGLFYAEYSDGLVSEPVAIATVGEGADLQGIVVSPSRAYAAFRPDVLGEPMLVDLRDGAPGPAVPLATAPATNPSAWFQFVPGDEAVVFETGSGTSGALTWVTALEDGVPQPPHVVAGPPLRGWTMQPLREIAGDGSWMLVESGPEGDTPPHVFVASLAVPDSGALLPLTDPDLPGHTPEDARVVPGDAAVIYRARGESFARDLWIVPIDAGVPGTHARISEPLPPPRDTWGVHAVHLFATGTGLVYWTAQEIGDTVGEFFWVALDGSVASSPALLGPPADANASPSQVFSSPDGRWVAYVADDPAAGDRPLWLVDVSGPMPSAPMRVANPQHVAEARFDGPSSFLYYSHGVGERGSGFFRRSVLGPSLGEPQQIDGEGEFGSGHVFSWDDGKVAWVRIDPGHALHVVDVAGAEPSPIALGDPELPGAHELWFSADADVVLFTMPGGGPDSSLSLQLVDLLIPGQLHPVLDTASFVRVLAD